MRGDRRRSVAGSERLGDEDGQGLAEYALLASLIAIIAIAALVILGNEISSILSSVGVAI